MNIHLYHLLRKVAKTIKENGTEGYCTTNARFVQSKKYHAGQKVFASGNGGGAKNNWHRTYYFVCSLRYPSDIGGFLCLNDKGKFVQISQIDTISWAEKTLLNGWF